METLVRILFIIVAGLLLCGSASAGLSYLDPIGGWTYIYTGDSATAGSGGFDSLDGTWDHDNGTDQWDGTQIGAGRPGGVSALTETGTNFIRLQDTGDPRDYGMGDPGSNRKITFGHSITNDIGASAANILDGVTLTFRSRVATGAPLDDAHPDGGGGVFPWPAGGDGYVTHDGGKGNFGIGPSSGDIVSFSLVLPVDAPSLSTGGLLMNNLNGNTVTSQVDWGEAGTTNLLSLDPVQWHEYWITIQQDTTGTGTHRVDAYLDGSLVPATFIVTAGTGGSIYTDSYLAMGIGSTPQSGAIDVDFFAYKSGVTAPGSAEVIPAPGALLLGSLGMGLVSWMRRRRTL